MPGTLGAHAKKFAPSKPSGSRSGSIADSNSMEETQQSKHLKKPQNEGNDNHNVQDLLNLAIHGNVVVYEPQQNPNHDNNYYQLNQIHS
jgi:hypothetical protein